MPTTDGDDRGPQPVPNDRLALMLGGGGARGAYQAGVLRGIARRHPHLRIPILAGISAGAVNTTFLAAHPGALEDAAEGLVRLWLSITPDQVFEVHAVPVGRNVLRWARRLISGRHGRGEPMKGLVDTTPLRRFLERALVHDTDGTIPGIARNLAAAGGGLFLDGLFHGKKIFIGKFLRRHIVSITGEHI